MQGKWRGISYRSGVLLQEGLIEKEIYMHPIN
jgi:hypothetical protein